MKKIIQYLLFLFSGILIAQQTATSAVLIEKALKEKEILEKTSLVKTRQLYKYRSNYNEWTCCRY